jgi:hypothetical protein
MCLGDRYNRKIRGTASLIHVEKTLDYRTSGFSFETTSGFSSETTSGFSFETTSGFQLHLFSRSEAEPVLNPFSRETEFADPIEPLSPIDICDTSAIYAAIPRDRFCKISAENFSDPFSS